jgi:DNA-binding GntR family transcriptional regulator
MPKFSNVVWHDKAKTIADAIYASLKESIVNLDFEPGEKISEQQLVKLFGVSKAPIRDALQRLQQEKLVLIRPQSGTIISPVPSREKANSICEIRLLLEPYAAKIAARVITEEDKLNLRAAFAEVDPARKDDEALTLVHRKTDLLLHSTIWRLSNNSEIMSILTNYQQEIRRIGITTARFAARLHASMDEMVVINGALQCNDPESCSQGMYNHIYNLQQALLKVYADHDV